MNRRPPTLVRLLSGLAMMTLLSAPDIARAEAFRITKCESRETTGWNFYCREPEPEETEEPTNAPRPPMPEIAETPEPEEPREEPISATEQMMAFRAHVDELKHRAVLDPTPENVLAYMEVNKMVADRAGDFAEQWQRVLFETPHLNANVDSPLAAAGISVFQDQMKAARESTFVKVAQTSGILFIFEGDARCGICRVQGEILAQMEQHFGVSILAVSKDGGANAYFPQAYADHGRLSELGLQDFPAPTLALIDPNTNEVSVMGSGLITADQILERVHLITEIPPGEQY